VRADDEELVPAKAHRNVRAADGFADALCHHLEQLVAGGMAHAVVDQLEAIQIDEHQAHLAAIPGRAVQFDGQLFVQQMRLPRSVSAS
jgi:hypothetical protein